MKTRIGLLAITCVGCVAGHNVLTSACTPGAYRCGAASGKGTTFFQCDGGGTEVEKSCAPGTVCYAQGGNSILCSYPVDTASGPAPASEALVAGAQCSFASPFDEYMCPGANGQHGYYLRCLSGTYVHFPCAPGTACHKSEGQNMFCGQWAGNAAAPSVPPAGSEATGVSSIEMPALSSQSYSSSLELATSTSSSLSLDVDIGAGIGLTSTGLFDITGTYDIVSSGSSSHVGGMFDDYPPLFPGSTILGNSDSDTSSNGLPSAESTDSTAATESTSSLSMELSSDETSTMAMDMPTGSSTMAMDMPSENGTQEPSLESSENAPSTTAEPETSSSQGPESPEDASTSNSSSSSSVVEGAGSSNPSPAPTNGLTGPIISSGLEMLLNNGVQLPFTLPNIELPAVDLATVHLPDMTFDGLALTAIPLPSITIPPLNPASMTQFSYIEGIMSKAGITFDDLAKLQLPDLSHMDLSALGQINPALLLSLVNINRVPAPTGQTNANNIAAEVAVATASPQTTTLGANDIDALLGLSVITHATA
ncbi:hypothetical protein IWW48_004929 [Coemansia sp. RSA 1200]|nr:hypothetical protein IWW48_004929 [Coemansia sp. RSA 1200]